MTRETGPEYQRLMDLIRSRIASGDYATGAKIPSTKEWERDGWSRDTTRTAITRLQRDGILEGHGGVGVFVKATPEQAAAGLMTLEALTEEVGRLRRELAELRERVGRMAAQLATLGKKPRGGKREQADSAADGGRR